MSREQEGVPSIRAKYYVSGALLTSTDYDIHMLFYNDTVTIPSGLDTESQTLKAVREVFVDLIISPKAAKELANALLTQVRFFEKRGNI